MQQCRKNQEHQILINNNYFRAKTKFEWTKNVTNSGSIQKWKKLNTNTRTLALPCRFFLSLFLLPLELRNAIQIQFFECLCVPLAHELSTEIHTLNSSLEKWARILKVHLGLKPWVVLRLARQKRGTKIRNEIIFLFYVGPLYINYSMIIDTCEIKWN